MRADGAVLLDPGSVSTVDIASLKDRSPHGNDGTFTGIDIVREPSGLQTMEFGGTGSGDYVDFGNDKSLDVPQGLTVMIWAYNTITTGAGRKPTLIEKDPLNMYNLYMEQNGLGFYATLKVGGSYVFPQITADNHLNEWVHIAFTFATANYSGYVNGALTLGPVAKAGTVDAATGPLILSRVGDSREWEGKLALPIVLSRALSAGEILQHYNSQLPWFR